MLRNSIIIFFSCLIARLFFIIFFPTTGGDYEIYETVAENILRGCGVSLSDPYGKDCIPHFGGNHGPGYDFFLAFVWFFFGKSGIAVRLTQCVIYCCAVLYTMSAIKRLTKDDRISFYVGLVLSLSPLLIAWPRYLQTETLALASVLFLIAELINSYREKKIRILSLALAITIATWIRLDNIFLCVPIAVACFSLHGIKRGIFYGALVATLLSLSWGSWTIRNINVGLPSILPSDMIMPDGSRSPLGYLSWTKTWMTNEYEKPGALWGVNRKNYLNISIPEYAYKSDIEKMKVTKLIKALKANDRKDFPKFIDDEFKNIAINKRLKYPFEYWIINPLKRTFRMWTNPFSSFGWPNEIPSVGLSHEERLGAFKGNFVLLKKKIIEHPLQSASKFFNALYRGIEYILFLICFFIAIKQKNSFMKYFSLCIFFYILVRTLFFAINANFETRYILSCIPFIEVLVLLVFFQKYKRIKTP